MNLDISTFLQWEAATKDTIDFKKAYVDMAGGDLIAGLMLSQIVFYYLPDKKGGSKLRVEKEGHLWIAKRHSEWHDEIRVTEWQAPRALDILANEGLITKKVFRFNGSPTVHIRLNFDKFLKAWKAMLSDSSQMPESNLVNPLNPFAPNARLEASKPLETLTETTAQTTKEGKGLHIADAPAPPPRFRVGDVVRHWYDEKMIGPIARIEVGLTGGWYCYFGDDWIAEENSLQPIEQEQQEADDYLPEWASEFDKVTPKTPPVKANVVTEAPPIPPAPPKQRKARERKPSQSATSALKEAYKEAVTSRGLNTQYRNAKEALDQLEGMGATVEEVAGAVEQATSGWAERMYFAIERVPDAVRTLRAQRGIRPPQQSVAVASRTFAGSGNLTNFSALGIPYD